MVFSSLFQKITRSLGWPGHCPILAWSWSLYSWSVSCQHNHASVSPRLHLPLVLWTWAHKRSTVLHSELPGERLSGLEPWIVVHRNHGQQRYPATKQQLQRTGFPTQLPDTRSHRRTGPKDPDGPCITEESSKATEVETKINDLNSREYPGERWKNADFSKVGWRKTGWGWMYTCSAENVLAWKIMIR